MASPESFLLANSTSVILAPDLVNGAETEVVGISTSAGKYASLAFLLNELLAKKNCEIIVSYFKIKIILTYEGHYLNN